MAIDFDKKSNIPKLTKEQLIQQINRALEDNTLTIRHTTAFTNKALKLVKSDKQYRIHLQDTLKAYQYMLDTGCSIEEALEYALQFFSIENITLKEFIKLSKNNKVYNIKSNIKNSDSHPVQKGMIKHGVFRRKALNKCKTPNEQLGELQHTLKLYDKILTLQSENDNLRITNDLIKANHEQVMNNQSEIKDMITSLTSKEELKVIAANLKSKGYTQEQVATTIDKSVRTIQRWWNEL